MSSTEEKELQNELTDFKEKDIKIDYEKLELTNYNSLLQMSVLFKQKYSNIIVTSEEDLKGLIGRNSITSNLNKISKTINKARIAYEKEIKKRSALPSEQLKEIKQNLDDTIESIKVNVDKFNEELQQRNEKRLVDNYNKVLNDFETNDAFGNEGVSELYNLFMYEVFFKPQYINKTNHVSKMKDKGQQNFISKYLETMIETISEMKTTAFNFAQKGISLSKKVVNEQIEMIIKTDLIDNEIPNKDVSVSKMFNWLNDQKRIYEQNVFAEQQKQIAEQQKLEEQQRQIAEQQKLEEQQRQIAEQQAQEVNNDQISSEVTSQENITINNEPQQEENQKEYYELIFGANKEQLAKLEEFIAEIGIDKISLTK